MRLLSRRHVPALLGGAAVAYWLLVKAALFDRLDYLSDLFSFLQMSISVFGGRPLLYENAYGDHRVIHNYYVMPLFYPLTHVLGAYGLFVGHALLLIAAVVSVLALARADTAEKRVWYWSVVAALVLGPVSFWIWDDQPYGFHGELLFLPLSVLFTTSLLRRSRAAWLFAALLAFTREEGPIVAWSIHAVYEVTRSDPELATSARPAAGRIRRVAAVTATWLLLFCVGMAIQLAIQRGHSSVRDASTAFVRLAGVWHAPGLRGELVASFIDALLLLLTSWFLLLGGLDLRAPVAAAVCSVAILVPATLGSSFYAVPNALRGHGISWSPRFVMLWGLFAAAWLFSIHSTRTSTLRSRLRRGAIAFALVAASVVAQIAVLETRKQYSLERRIAPIWLGGGAGAALSRREDQFLRCLGRRLPHPTPVACSGTLFGRFHRQDLVWPERVGTAWRFPALVLCDDQGRWPGFDYGCLQLRRTLPASGFAQGTLDGLSFSYGSDLAGVIESCQGS